MEHRIFIAINPSQEIKEKIFKHQLSFPNLPVNWTKKENLHITLSFLGYTKDESIAEIINSVEEVSARHHSFFLELNKVCYGPTIQNPRMIWVTGKKSKEMGELKNDLEKKLLNAQKRKDSVFKEGLSPHITLGRLKRSDFKQISPEERPIIDKDIFEKFEVTSIDIIESELEPSGAQYTLLQSINLGKF